MALSFDLKAMAAGRTEDGGPDDITECIIYGAMFIGMPSITADNWQTFATRLAGLRDRERSHRRAPRGDHVRAGARTDRPDDEREQDDPCSVRAQAWKHRAGQGASGSQSAPRRRWRHDRPSLRLPAGAGRERAPVADARCWNGPRLIPFTSLPQRMARPSRRGRRDVREVARWAGSCEIEEWTFTDAAAHRIGSLM